MTAARFSYFRIVCYEGESISNQPILFLIDRDGHDFHALSQYMFYTWVQNCTLIESFFNKILNQNLQRCTACTALSDSVIRSAKIG